MVDKSIEYAWVIDSLSALTIACTSPETLLLTDENLASVLSDMPEQNIISQLAASTSKSQFRLEE